jgi:N-acetylmuramoyl-L-alanine amidase CwlA
MGWTEIVGQRFSSDEFGAYVRSLIFGSFRPKFVVVHNTAAPTIKQRPQGFTQQHMKNLVSFYRDAKKWSAGPHLFVDQNGIWVFTPLTMPGVHSPSWNHESIGVETLGNYETEPFEGPIKEHLIACLALLHDALHLDPARLKFHKDDANTTHKGCPGKNLDRFALLADLAQRLAAPARTAELNNV